MPARDAKKATRGVLELVVGDPPSKKGRGAAYDFMPLLEQLMIEFPGQWARIGVWKTPSAATAWRRTLQEEEERRPEGLWEFMSRRMPDGQYGLWARYNGEY